MISSVLDLLCLVKTNIRSATECNLFLCCHAQIQQWLDLLKTKEGNLSIVCTTHTFDESGGSPQILVLKRSPLGPKRQSCRLSRGGSFIIFAGLQASQLLSEELNYISE
jgi:hypothetical protein